jgi:hypothetical protein
MKTRQAKEFDAARMLFPDSTFRKSSYSGKFDGNSNCVEVAVAQDAIGVRDSKNRNDSVLRFTRSEWDAFIQGVKAGEFDLR